MTREIKSLTVTQLKMLGDDFAVYVVLDDRGHEKYIGDFELSEICSAEHVETARRYRVDFSRGFIFQPTQPVEESVWQTL